jgi:transposase
MDTSEQTAIESTKQEKRRRRSVEEKRRIVEETLEAGASVARVARRHAVNANQVFYWRKKYREGRLGKKQSSKLLPVTLSDISWSKSGRASCASLPFAVGSMEIKLAKGTLRVAGKHRRGGAAYSDRVSGRMIGLPAGTRIWIAAGVTDLRRGFTGLSGMVQTALKENPFSGHVFVFRGRRGDLIKMLWWDGDGLCLFAKRLERGRFLWPQATSGTVALTPAQLSMLLEGIDWRRPVRSYDPQMAV